MDLSVHLNSHLNPIRKGKKHSLPNITYITIFLIHFQLIPGICLNESLITAQAIIVFGVRKDKERLIRLVMYMSFRNINIDDELMQERRFICFET